jgi:hypothetical protein
MIVTLRTSFYEGKTSLVFIPSTDGVINASIQAPYSSVNRRFPDAAAILRICELTIAAPTAIERGWIVFSTVVASAHRFGHGGGFMLRNDSARSLHVAILLDPYFRTCMRKRNLTQTAAGVRIQYMRGDARVLQGMQKQIRIGQVGR